MIYFRQAQIAAILLLAAVCLSSCSDYVIETNEKDKFFY
jgi:hypothetical protein